MATTDLQKKNELRLELRYLEKAMEVFDEHLNEAVMRTSINVRDIKVRIEDIKTALQD